MQCAYPWESRRASSCNPVYKFSLYTLNPDSPWLIYFISTDFWRNLFLEYCSILLYHTRTHNSQRHYCRRPSKRFSLQISLNNQLALNSTSPGNKTIDVGTVITLEKSWGVPRSRWMAMVTMGQVRLDWMANDTFTLIHSGRTVVVWLYGPACRCWITRPNWVGCRAYLCNLTSPSDVSYIDRWPSHLDWEKFTKH